MLGKHVPQDSQVLSNEISKVQRDSKFDPNGSSSPETRELNKMKASPAKSKTIADDVTNKDARNFPVKFQPSLEAPMKSTGGRNSLSGIHTAKHYYEKISSSFPSTTPSPSYTSSSTFNRKSSFPTSKEPASVSTPLGTPTKSSSDNKSAITSNGYQNPIPRNIPVLCQVICGNGCCSPKLKTSLTQTFAQTTRTTEPTTKTKGELTSKPTEPPDVIATPPLPLWHLENNPQGFPKEEHPSLVPSLPAGPMPRPAMDPLPTFATPRMDRTLTPATLSPNEQTKETLPFGKNIIVKTLSFCTNASVFSSKRFKTPRGNATAKSYSFEITVFIEIHSVPYPLHTRMWCNVKILNNKAFIFYYLRPVHFKRMH